MALYELDCTDNVSARRFRNLYGEDLTPALIGPLHDLITALITCVVFNRPRDAARVRGAVELLNPKEWRYACAVRAVINGVALGPFFERAKGDPAKFVILKLAEIDARFGKLDAVYVRNELRQGTLGKSGRQSLGPARLAVRFALKSGAFDLAHTNQEVLIRSFNKAWRKEFDEPAEEFADRMARTVHFASDEASPQRTSPIRQRRTKQTQTS